MAWNWFWLALRNGKLDSDLAMHCLEAFTVEKTKHERQMVYKLFGCYIQQMMKMIAELVLQPAIWFWVHVTTHNSQHQIDEFCNRFLCSHWEWKGNHIVRHSSEQIDCAIYELCYHIASRHIRIQLLENWVTIPEGFIKFAAGVSYVIRKTEHIVTIDWKGIQVALCIW